MSDELDRDPAAAALRASLARHAQEAPSGALVAERILAAAGRPESPARPRPSRGWRTWALPLIAAGAVAAVVGIAHYRPHADKAPTAGSHLPTAPPSLTSAPSPTASASSNPTNRVVATSGGTRLHSVRILDLTFAGTDNGWALASSKCVHGSGRCTALLRTTDGRTWRDMPGAAFNVADVKNCAAPCVQHLRFANDKIGYAFGPDALFMTHDGGRSWSRQEGGAILLESLDRNVIRVTSTGTGCPGPCNLAVETAGLGASKWTKANLVPALGTGFALARGGGGKAYLLVTRNRAGGARATSTLYRSTDDGRRWHSVSEPCPQLAGEVDSVSVAAAPAGRLSVLCSARFSQQGFVATSTDAGRHFAKQRGVVPELTANMLSGDPRTVLVSAGIGLARSADGGGSWQPVPGVTGEVSFAGFESEKVGRVVANGGRTIWTTRDGGASWSAVTFG